MSNHNLFCIDSGTKKLHEYQVTWSKSSQGAIYIINYDLVSKWLDKFIEIDPKTIIIDEAHFIKNNKAKRTKNIKKLAKGREIIALTGTPIINKPVEFFNILNLIEPDLFNNWFSYVKRYCGAYQDRYGWDVSGSTNSEELHALASKCMIRRLKKDVLTQLPSKIRSVIPLEINNKKQYDFAKKELIQYLTEKKGSTEAIKAKNAETLVRIETLKQIVVKGKIKGIIEWIKDYLESNDKLVVFCTHLDVMAKLKETFRDICVEVNGSITGVKRDQAVNEFQNNPNIRLFIGNKAAGVGITLTAANSTCTIELPWSPGDCDQQEDRVHRIGQESDIVNAFYLIGQNTIEEEIIELLDKKRKVLDSVVDGKITNDESLLSELIKKNIGKYYEK